MEKVNKRRSALKKLGIGIAGIFGFSSIKAGEKPKKKIELNINKILITPKIPSNSMVISIFKYFFYFAQIII